MESPLKVPPKMLRQADAIFYTPEDLRSLDRVFADLENLDHPHQRPIPDGTSR